MRKVFYGHVLIGLACLIFGMWAATQYAAGALGYQKALGLPIATIADVPIYWPWQWMVWAYYYTSYAPWIFDRASWITWGSVFVMFGLMVTLAIFRAKKSATSVAYGSARWATLKDLKRAGLLGDDGVFLAQTNDAVYRCETDRSGKQRWVMKRDGELIRHNGPEHVFCFAPTRSGKGVGLVIPTLVSWLDSVLVYDIKKENWALTAGWRRQFSHCWRFEPTAPGSVRFNPLMEVRQGDREVQDAQNIADILVDPEGSGQKRDHWQNTGHSLLVGAILHVLYAEDDKSLKGVSDFLSNPQRGIKQTLEHMMTTCHTGRQPHPVVAATAREMLNKSDNELSGVISTANSYLSLYRDTIIAKNTAASDFAIADLMNAEAPVSLYLVVPPSDIERTKPLIRLMLNQIGRRLTESMEFGDKKAYKHRLLMLLDEFPSLGQLGFFETELAYLAGYGIKCFMIAQSLNQIEKAYGQNNSILDNAHVRVTYGALDERTARRVSDLLGQATEQRQQTNFSGNRLAPWLGHMSESSQEFARPLLTPGEVLQLPFDEALVMIGGMPPYRAKKVMYYQDDRLKDRVKMPAPDSAQEQTAELLPTRPSPWSAGKLTALPSQGLSNAPMHPSEPADERGIPAVPPPVPKAAERAQGPCSVHELGITEPVQETDALPIALVTGLPLVQGAPKRPTPPAEQTTEEQAEAATEAAAETFFAAWPTSTASAAAETETAAMAESEDVADRSAETEVETDPDKQPLDPNAEPATAPFDDPEDLKIPEPAEKELPSGNLQPTPASPGGQDVDLSL